MNFDLKLGKAASVLFLALAMAGCGGGGGTTTAPPEPTPMPDPAIAERADIKMKIMAAQTAVNAVDNESTDAEVSAAETAITAAKTAIAAADNVPMDEKAANTGTVNALETQLSGAKMARMAAMDDAAKAAAKDALALFNGFGDAGNDNTADLALGALTVTDTYGGSAKVTAGRRWRRTCG